VAAGGSWCVDALGHSCSSLGHGKVEEGGVVLTRVRKGDGRRE
jgi:hypothetical protein